MSGCTGGGLGETRGAAVNGDAAPLWAVKALGNQWQGWLQDSLAMLNPGNRRLHVGER